MAKKERKAKKKTHEKAVYLGDLTPEEVLKAMLQVKPPKRKARKSPAVKRG